MPVGLFVYCIVVRSIGVNLIVVTGSVHFVGSAPCVAAIVFPAASIAAHSSFERYAFSPLNGIHVSWHGTREPTR
jgi:hypothetical protein